MTNHRGAFSVVELLVVIFVIALIIGMMLPAVQAVREGSRRTSCANNLRQIALAGIHFESAHGVYQKFGWNQEYCQYLEIDLSIFEQLYPKDAMENLVLSFPVFKCPSDPVSNMKIDLLSNYLGCSGARPYPDRREGIFVLDSDPAGPFVQPGSSAISDGLSKTAFFAEVLVANAAQPRTKPIWMPPGPRYDWDEYNEFAGLVEHMSSDPESDGFINLGAKGTVFNFFASLDPPSASLSKLTAVSGLGYNLYNHALQPNQPALTAGPNELSIIPPSSFHGSKVNVAFADGHVRMMDGSIDSEIWEAMGTIDGAE